MPPFKWFANLFRKSKPSSVEEPELSEDYKSQTTKIRSQCTVLQETMATTVDEGAAQLAIASDEHKHVRSKLNNILDEVTAKTKAG